MSTKRPVAKEATAMNGRGDSGVRIRSPLGLLSALAILSALPIAVGCQILFGSGGGTTIHLAFAAGCLLLASSVFDFELPRWIYPMGCAFALALGAIFLFPISRIREPADDRAVDYRAMVVIASLILPS